ncbi:hypothetical protein ACO9S2_04350 [Nitrospira sp. NS4]|uniref:hypothetical protein n=1 Tax=Nitrospira sp. NS4 TaxID=3414498 RepID=UPI003C2F86A2
MKRNGTYALDFQGPALVGGHITYLRGRRYLNRVVALCFLPYARLVPAEKLDRQARRFHEIGAALLIVASIARPLHRLWAGERDKPVTPVLADLCGRLHRSFGVPVEEPARRYQTFIIDRTGILRLRVNHDFFWQDLTVLGSTIGVTPRPAANERDSDADSRAAGALSLPG